MTPTGSAAVHFHSLGTREGIFHNDHEKADMFRNAIQSMKTILRNPASDNPILSAPQLLARVFDQNDVTPDIQNIRRALQHTHFLHLHDVSATGTKLLACLAITQHPECFDGNGNLRLDYTKNIIQGWFANGKDVKLDDSALRNIRLDGTDPTLETKQIILGKNRLATVGLAFTDEIKTLFEANRTASNVGRHRIALDLSAMPVKSVKQPFQEAVLGDMNGNALMMLHEMVHLGFAEIAPGKEKDWHDLARQIKDNQIEGFSQKLAEVIHIKPSGKKLTLLGDLLADRAYNDWFTLCIIDHLHASGQPFDITLSNHDAAFIEYFLTNKDSPDPISYRIPTGDLGKYRVTPCDSLIQLDASLNARPELKTQFKQIASNYLSHVRMLSCDTHQETLYAHAVVNQAMLADMLTKSGVDVEDQDNMPLKQKIDHINLFFRDQALGSAEKFLAFLEQADPSLPDYDVNQANPFFFAIWNIGPFTANQHLGYVKRHPYCNADLPAGAKTAVHGHTADMSERHDNDQALLKAYDDLKMRLTARTLIPDTAEGIIAAVSLLMEAERHHASRATLSKLLIVLVDAVKSLGNASSLTELGSSVEDFFSECDRFPKQDNLWFDKYNNTYVDDPIMQEKQRQQRTNKSGKVFYASVPKDSAASVAIKKGFEQSKQESMRKLVDSLEKIFTAVHVLGNVTPPKMLRTTLESLAEDCASVKGEVVQKLTPQTTSSPEAVTRHTGLMIEYINSGREKITNQFWLEQTILSRPGMNNYQSLDNHFGGLPSDVIGEQRIYLA